jgi:hypothetical protein
MVPTCLFMKFMEGMNYKSFEDQERILEEIKSLFFQTLYLWTAAYISPLSISHSDFLVLFIHSS